MDGGLIANPPLLGANKQKWVPLSLDAPPRPAPKGSHRGDRHREYDRVHRDRVERTGEGVHRDNYRDGQPHRDRDSNNYRGGDRGYQSHYYNKYGGSHDRGDKERDQYRDRRGGERYNVPPRYANQPQGQDYLGGGGVEGGSGGYGGGMYEGSRYGGRGGGRPSRGGGGGRSWRYPSPGAVHGKSNHVQGIQCILLYVILFRWWARDWLHVSAAATAAASNAVLQPGARRLLPTLLFLILTSHVLQWPHLTSRPRHSSRLH